MKIDVKETASGEYVAHLRYRGIYGVLGKSPAEAVGTLIIQNQDKFGFEIDLNHLPLRFRDTSRKGRV